MRSGAGEAAATPRAMESKAILFAMMTCQLGHVSYRRVPLLPYTCAHASCVRPLPQPTIASE